MKIPYQGKDIEVQEVDVVSSNEPWNEYQLGDGRVLSLKTVLVSAYRAVDERGPDGLPLYVVNSQSIVKIK